MELIEKLETTIADWYKEAPRLPQKGRMWLSSNAWWIVLVGVVLGSLSIITIVLGTLLTGTLLTLFGGIVGAAVGGVLLGAVLMNVAFSIVELVLLGLAVLPLKDGRRKGWVYLFVVFLLSALSAIISFVLRINASGLMGLVINVICLAVWGYFLFEIRSAFGAAKVAPASEA